MGLFKKKKEVETEEDIPKLPELPELPGAPELPTMPSEYIPDVPAGLPEIETKFLSQTLPTFYSNPIERDFNQQAIKHEIRKPEILKSTLMPSISQNIPRTIEPKRTLELSTPTKRISSMTKKLEPVFIRLDKFQTTLETFEEIKEKIEEIEELLSRTREIKQKEEQELANWEREIQTIKARIDLIDKTIFNKLD